MNTNKNIFRTILTLAFIALCLNGCADSDQESTPTPDSAGQQTTQSQPGPVTEQTIAPDKPKSTKIEWMHSVSEGLALAKKTGKPALIDFYADWCPPCKKMDKTTFPDARVIAELARFVTIKADLTRSSSKGQPAAKEYNVQAIPTYIFIDTTGKQTIEMGYRPPDEFLRILKGIE